MKRGLVVEQPGPLLTVQDLGRPGLASLGVPESGALDPAALRLANRLVGNEEDTAGLEVTLGQASLRAHGSLVLAVSGAPVPVSVDGRAHGRDISIRVPDGALVELGAPTRGLRSYLAVRGGLRARRGAGLAQHRPALRPGGTPRGGRRAAGRARPGAPGARVSTRRRAAPPPTG